MENGQSIPLREYMANGLRDAVVAGESTEVSAADVLGCTTSPAEPQVDRAPGPNKACAVVRRTRDPGLPA